MKYFHQLFFYTNVILFWLLYITLLKLVCCSFLSLLHCMLLQFSPLVVHKHSPLPAMTILKFAWLLILVVRLPSNSQDIFWYTIPKIINMIFMSSLIPYIYSKEGEFMEFHSIQAAVSSSPYKHYNYVEAVQFLCLVCLISDVS